MQPRNLLICCFLFFLICSCSVKNTRETDNFCSGWKFCLGNFEDAGNPLFNDSAWRIINLPHDWSIEGQFSKDNPATPGGGALPGGVGWYRKTFNIPVAAEDKRIFVDFDGVYMNSEVWINGEYLGKRPYGYSSFRYELTPFLKYGNENNVIAVKVDNSKQPNSRWYSGSGIYRNVWMVFTGKIYIDHWGTFITTPEISENQARVVIKTRVKNSESSDQPVKLKTIILSPEGKEIATAITEKIIKRDSVYEFVQEDKVTNPLLWSVDNPLLYKAISQVITGNKLTDEYTTDFGIRFFDFDTDKGFLLNGEQFKIKGVCNHHDLGCLGTAVNTRAIERQLEILKKMGCNGIRTSHNPPAPELLDLCDRMGFIVMDEAFDIWKEKKTEYDYSLYFDQWHKRDLEDMILRDRNHPSVFMWSIGNEVMEQWDTIDFSGIRLAGELASIVRDLDTTRPITSACNGPGPWNYVIRSGALDLIGYNYGLDKFPDFPKTFPGKKFIASETTSALATRGHYDMPSDSIRRWPFRWDVLFTSGNPGNTVSAYDNTSTPWGSTHEETWKIIKKYDFLSGLYIWTGFDYLGEPTPYDWPSRSSYFGIVDLAGFPKDAYYMYQSEWTDEPVLHIFPPWNLPENLMQEDSIDIWAYFNCDEVELFVNGESQGTKQKGDDEFHTMWRLKYVPGTLKAVGRTGGEEVMTRIIKTAGDPATIELTADRNIIKADGRDLSFITVRILDKEGNFVPYADNMINFDIQGEAFIAGVDNGCQTSHEPFKANYRRAFNGMCLAVLQSTGKNGEIVLKADSEGLQSSVIKLSAE